MTSVICERKSGFTLSLDLLRHSSDICSTIIDKIEEDSGLSLPRYVPNLDVLRTLLFFFVEKNRNAPFSEEFSIPIPTPKGLIEYSVVISYDEIMFFK